MSKNTVIFVIILMLGISTMTLFIKRNTINENTNETNTVVLDNGTKNMTEEEKQQKKDEYAKQQIEELFDSTDWSGREDEKEKYREQFLEQFLGEQ